MTTTIDPRTVTALEVIPAAGCGYQLTDEDGCPFASLRVGWLVRRGEISTEQGAWSVRRYGRGRVRTGEDDQPLVTLSGAASVVPGPAPDAHWSIMRNRRAYTGTLIRNDETIVIRAPALSGRQFAIELTGDWEQRDVVVLTACFALLARRQRDLAIMIAISSSHAS
jgi:hypothetical protein